MGRAVCHQKVAGGGPHDGALAALIHQGYFVLKFVRKGLVVVEFDGHHRIDVIPQGDYVNRVVGKHTVITAVLAPDDVEQQYVLQVRDRNL